MGRIKLYDIAKELNIPSKELVDLAIKLKMDVKSHLSAISEEDAEKLRKEAKNQNLKNTTNKMNLIFYKYIFVKRENFLYLYL